MKYQPPTDAGLDLVFEDPWLLVLNKPGGLLSVPGREAQLKDSLATRVQARFPEALIVHRLDLETSGLIVMARNAEVHRHLGKLFETRQVQKTYIAVVEGQLENSSGTIDLPLISDWPNRPRQKVDFTSGKPSITHYTMLAYRPENHSTRVRLEPQTGRSHQLRVHMMSIGHAILGDRLYASTGVQAKADRLLLHASALAFSHPLTLEPLAFNAAPPF